MCGSTGYYNEKYWGINDNRENKVDFRFEEEYPGAWLYSANKAAEPRAQGNYNLRVDSPEGASLSCRSWREAKELWEQIKENKPLKAEAHWFEGSCAIVGISGRLASGCKTIIRFAVSWYFPNLHEQWNPEKSYGVCMKTGLRIPGKLRNTF